MKFVIRRLIAGVIAIPVVAGTYTAFYLFLILAGGEPTQTLTETFSTGISIAITLAIALAFYPQISRTLDKVLA
jgi:hypothetical protein